MTTDISLFLSQLRSNVFRTNTSKLLWFCLMRDVGDDGTVKTSALSIAKEIGVNEKTVRNILDKLMKEGLIDMSNQSFAPNDSPILSPKKVRHMGRVVKLNVLGTCIAFSKSKIRKKPDTYSDIKSDVSKAPLATSTTQPQDGFERFREWFNDTISSTGIPRLIKLTDARKNALRSIFKEYDRETVETVVQKVIASDFLAREWGKVGFDWIFKKANFIKILEGNYDNRNTQTQTEDKYSARRGTDVENHSPDDYEGAF